MSKLVLYYSLSGNTARIAAAFAGESGAEIVAVKTEGKVGTVKAYTVGAFNSMTGKGMPIQDLGRDLSGVSEVDVFAPIWAGVIAAPMNAALARLSAGTKVFLHMVSGSGKSNREKNEKNVRALGLEVSGYEDLK